MRVPACGAAPTAARRYQCGLAQNGFRSVLHEIRLPRGPCYTLGGIRGLRTGYAARVDGIARLRAARGDERVTFADVADHLVDFGDRDPGARDVLDRLARFLAEVERVDHDHEMDPERGVAGTPEAEVPAVR